MNPDFNLPQVICYSKSVKNFIFAGTCFFLPSFVLAVNEVPLNPSQNVAAIVRKAPPGTRFVFAPGEYRMVSIAPKDHDVFTSEGGGVVLNGSQVLSMQPDGGRWSATVARAQWGPGHCLADHPRCWILNDLFIDDQLQTPVDHLENLATGQWFYDDATGKAYIPTNPAGHRIEFGTQSSAFWGKANGIEISYLTIEKYASPPQNGAVGGHGAGNAIGWTITRSVVQWNHGTGIDLGAHAHVSYCHIVHNGQKGLGGHGENVLIEHNEIAFNGAGGYDPGWEAGATKFSDTDHLIVRSNDVHDNVGGGLWNDIDNIHTLYEKNKLVNNDSGFRIEISYDVIIRNNLLKGNKSGIDIVCSPNVDVYGNTVEVPSGHTNDGIELTGGERETGRYGPRVAQHDHVHDNVIIYLGPEGHSGLSGGLEHAENNVFDHNEYDLAGGDDTQAHWNFHGGRTIEELRQAGFEQHSLVKTGITSHPDPTQKSDGTYDQSSDSAP